MLKLYPFQQECNDKLGKPEILSCLIGDEMGLGKTVEAIARDTSLRIGKDLVGKTLIVAPLAVHDHWYRHLVDLFGFSPHQVCAIDRKDRAKFIVELNKSSNDPTCPVFYICHYEAVRLMPELQSVSWFHIVADEVHRIKNRKAQQTQKLKGLHTKYKTGCSGTPADNNPQDLWSVLNWLYPKQFSSYWRYVKQFCREEEVKGKHGASFRKVVGVNENTLPQLRAQMEPWYIRRLKDEVVDLPPKVYTEILVDLHPSQRRAYNQMRKDMIAWIGEHEDVPLVAPVVVAQLVRLQQFALASPQFGTDGKLRLVDPSAKADALMEIMEDNDGEAFVVFSQSRSMVELIAARCAAKKISSGLYTGMVAKRERDYNIQAFQGGDLRVLAATIAAGGEGITLTRARTCAFLDRHWSPTRNIQAEDRLHRIGQTRSVQILDFIGRNTLDLGRLQQIATKWETLRLLFGDTVDRQAYYKMVGAGQ